MQSRHIATWAISILDIGRHDELQRVVVMRDVMVIPYRYIFDLVLSKAGSGWLRLSLVTGADFSAKLSSDSRL